MGHSGNDRLKRKVSEIAREGLLGKGDTVMLIRELWQSYPEEKLKDAEGDVIFDLLSLLESQTDFLMKGEAQKYCSKGMLEKQSQEEKRVLDFYKDDISELFTYFSKVDF